MGAFCMVLDSFCMEMIAYIVSQSYKRDVFCHIRSLQRLYVCIALMRSLLN